MDGYSMDIGRKAKEKLKTIFPECFSEGRLDVQKLLSLCGETILEDEERYGFQWMGKSQSLKMAQKPTASTLRPVFEDSERFDTTQNLYLEGDNLEVLKLLQGAYYEKIKMIYIDPPYNTGHDFVYTDCFKEPVANARRGRRPNNHMDFAGRFHTNWLNMMYPRLYLAASLLRRDGVIFISIDDREIHHLRKLCDEIFGEDNFLGCFLWRKKSTSTNVANAQISPQVDYQLCYGKSLDAVLHRRKVPAANRQYPCQDALGKYRKVIIEKKDSGVYSRRTMKYTILGQPPREGKRWQIGEAKAREYEAKGRFIVEKGVIKLKIYEFEDHDTYSANPNLLLNCGSTNSANKETNIELFQRDNLFSNPKPTELIKHLLRLGTDRDSIVLDFFSGSATTAHSVMALNKEDGGRRSFIMVQLPEFCSKQSEAYQAGYRTICEIGKERIRRAGRNLTLGTEADGKNGGKKRRENRGQEESQQLTLLDAALEQPKVLDTGFRVFRLDSSNIKAWEENTQEAVQETIEGQADKRQILFALDCLEGNRKPGRRDLDLVYEFLLKKGLPLTVGVTATEKGGKTVYTVQEK